MTNDQENLTDSQQEDIVNEIEEKLATDRTEGLKLLRSFDHHKSEDLKWEILGMVWEFGLNSQDSIMRQELVNYMLDILINGTPFLQGQSVSFLMDYHLKDFDEQAIKKLESFSWSGEYGSEIIRLIGIADIRSKNPELEKVSSSEFNLADLNTLCNWSLD